MGLKYGAKIVNQYSINKIRIFKLTNQLSYIFIIYSDFFINLKHIFINFIKFIKIKNKKFSRERFRSSDL
jgi:hypothetical protein